MTLILILAVPAWATNGSNLIGVRPPSRAMGGVGVAALQDAIAAIFANPASMSFGPYAPGSEADSNDIFALSSSLEEDTVSLGLTFRF